MNSGQGSIVKSHKARPSGAPFPSTSAYNGTSIDPVTGQIVLGNDFGDTAAQLITLRELPLNGNQLYMTDANFLMQFASAGIVAVDTVNSNRVEINAQTVGAFMSVESDSALSNPPEFVLIDLSVIPHNTANITQDGTEFSISAQSGNRKMLTLDFPLGIYQIGDIGTNLNGSILTIDDTAQRMTIESAGSNYLFMDIPTLSFEFGQVGSNNSILIDGTNNEAQIFLNGSTVMDLAFGLGNYSIGDIDAAANSSVITIDDTNMEIDLFAGNGIRTTAPSANGNELWRLGKIIAGAVALDATQSVEVNIGGTVVKLLMAA